MLRSDIIVMSTLGNMKTNSKQDTIKGIFPPLCICGLIQKKINLMLSWYQDDELCFSFTLNLSY